MSNHQRPMEFHERGVFELAKTASGHEVQGFFCPGPSLEFDGKHYNPTSSACAVAIRMADNTSIVMMRSPRTKSRKSELFTNPNAMVKGDPNILDIYVNGEKQDWRSIGGSRFNGDAVGSKVPAKQKGEAVGESTFISKLHSKAARGESDIATAPTCVHDKDNKFTIDVSVPIIKGHWPLVYEMSVTILASDSEAFGLCGDNKVFSEVRNQKGRNGRYGYLNRGSDRTRVDSKDLLFTSVQLAELYDTCDMDPKNNDLQADHAKHKVKFCDSTGYTYSDAEKDCNEEFKGLSAELRNEWLDSCIIEECANEGHATALVAAEEKLQEAIEANQW